MIPHRISTIAPRSGSDWTERELLQLRQLESFCEASDHFEVELGRTDEDDPWWVFQAQEEIFCYIARVDRSYILSFPSIGRTGTSATIEPLIEAAHAALLRFVGTVANKPNATDVGSTVADGCRSDHRGRTAVR
jgi:hypothetical protein